MWNKPSGNKLIDIPNLYETEETPLQDKIIHLHFFIGNCDWYIAEYDGGDLFFGFVILNGDYHNAGWGYISFSELDRIVINGFQVDCDCFWRIRKASEVERIRLCSPDR